MSEYQYYEFQAVDRPLSERQMAELRGLSSRAQITPRGFVNVYNFGDFRGNPARLMEEYFDAFVYVANWGTRELHDLLARSGREGEFASRVQKLRGQQRRKRSLMRRPHEEGL